MRYSDYDLLLGHLVRVSYDVKRALYRHQTVTDEAGNPIARIDKCEICKRLTIAPASVNHRKDCPVPRLAAVLRQIMDTKKAEGSTTGEAVAAALAAGEKNG